KIRKQAIRILDAFFLNIINPPSPGLFMKNVNTNDT
ncbi:unnamed protein product, partial [marine sediment metagenome]